MDADRSHVLDAAGAVNSRRPKELGTTDWQELAQNAQAWRNLVS